MPDSSAEKFGGMVGVVFAMITLAALIVLGIGAIAWLWGWVVSWAS